MAVKNAYAEKPEVPYQKTSVPMPDVVAYLNKCAQPVEVRRSTYLIFRNESANGAKGVNNNYIGLQADGSRLSSQWDDDVVATTVVKENMTGKERRFIVFESWRSSIDYLLAKIEKRGLFIGGTAQPYARMKVNDKKDLARAYYKEWVTGDGKAEPGETEVKALCSIYDSAVKAII